MNRSFIIRGMLVMSMILLISSGAFALDQAGTPGQAHLSSSAADATPSTARTTERGAFFAGWLHLLDDGSADTASSGSTLVHASKVPKDIAKVLAASGGSRGATGFLILLALSLLSMGAGYLASLPVRRKIQAWSNTIQNDSQSDDSFSSRLQNGLLREFPSIISLVVLTVAATLLFTTISGLAAGGSKMVFQFVLGLFLVIQISTLAARLLVAPEDINHRLLTVSEDLIQPVYGLAWKVPAMILGSLLVMIFFRELGVRPQTLSWLFIIAGTITLSMIGALLFAMRLPVADAIRANLQSGVQGAYRARMADYWYVPALAYLLMCLLFWVGQELAGTAPRNGVLVASILAVPLYLFLSHTSKVIIHSVLRALNLFAVREPEAWEQTVPAEGDDDNLTPEEKTAELAGKVHRIFRFFLFAMVAIWILNLWGHNIPFADKMLTAFFESLVIVALALFCWQYASRYIERKIEEATPEDTENKEDRDDEFGGAAPRGRSHTLLPMLRKVLATVLLVLVTLIVISSFGVNIGPLLAGAGVLGLAIGFGAQKLVSDVLSGFFFLLDDAFRVGEYIQAGSVKGTVEGITLRNVLLRHHLGMLQVVPHSDLGSITNFMRGGIVVRFPLEFPYDTDIDKVRKIIKKVGQAMLSDPELGDDFILPVKSQGVNEITNSVMIIRVKFTAKPGKQFLIRREAYRRITEALNAKGIYYAHRKVIVDFPEDKPLPEMTDEQRRAALEGGAAASLVQESEQTKSA